MITNSDIGNNNKKRRQQSDGKVYLKESAKKRFSAKKNAIIGNSKAKNIKHYQLNRSKLLKDQQVFVKSFPGKTIRSMKHYIQPTLEENKLDEILLHVGNNNLSSAKNVN